jgi:hypothetical protein
MTVWSRRAPMFSVRSFTRVARPAISRTASGVKVSRMPSVLRAWYCLSQGVFRLRQDAFELLGPQGVELHPDGEPALHLGDQIRRLG